MVLATQHTCVYWLNLAGYPHPLQSATDLEVPTELLTGSAKIQSLYDTFLNLLSTVKVGDASKTSVSKSKVRLFIRKAAHNQMGFVEWEETEVWALLHMCPDTARLASRSDPPVLTHQWLNNRNASHLARGKGLFFFKWVCVCECTYVYMYTYIHMQMRTINFQVPNGKHIAKIL